MRRASRTRRQSDQRINPWKQFQGVWLPLWLLERPELTMMAKVLYAVLARAAGRKGVCWPSQRWLGKQIGVKERQLRNYLAELVEIQLIEVEQRGRRHGGIGQSASYWFLKHRWMTQSVNYARQAIAGQNASPGSTSAGQKPPGSKGSRARPEESHTEEERKRGGKPARADVRVNGRSHSDRRGKPDIGDGTVRGLVGGLAGKFAAGVPRLTGPVDTTE